MDEDNKRQAIWTAAVRDRWLRRAQDIVAAIAVLEDDHERQVQRAIDWAEEQLKRTRYRREDNGIRVCWTHDKDGTILTVHRPWTELTEADRRSLVFARGQDQLREPIEIVEHVQTMLMLDQVHPSLPSPSSAAVAGVQRLERAGITIDVKDGQIIVSADLATIDGIIERADEERRSDERLSRAGITKEPPSAAVPPPSDVDQLLERAEDDVLAAIDRIRQQRGKQNER